MTVPYRIAKTLGRGNSLKSITNSGTLAFTFFFYIFSFGSYLNIPIYIIESRITNNTFFTNSYVITRNIDHVIIISGTILWLVLSTRGKTRLITSIVYGILCLGIFFTRIDSLFDIIVLVSIPLILSFVIYYSILNKKIPNVHSELSINYFAAICVVLGLVSIFMSVISILYYKEQIVQIKNYAYMLYLLASGSATIMMFMLIFCFPVKLFIKECEKIISRLTNEIASVIPINKKILKTKTKVFYLLLILSLSLLLAIIPHESYLNKDNHYIGADSTDYIDSIRALENSTNLGEFFQRAFVTNIHIQGDRPLSLIFLYGLAKISPADLNHTIDYAPVILGPSLAIIIYFLTREITSNEITSILASFLTVVSFHTLVGIYSGFYANWFALIIGYSSFVFLFRYLKRPSKKDLITYIVLLILLLFAHIYTWSVLTLVAVIFLLTMLKLKSYPRIRIIFLLLVTLSSVAIDFVRMPATGSYSGIASDIRVADVYKVGIAQFISRWDNLDDSVHGYYGAMFGNFIILFLGFYWILRSDFRQPYNIFLGIYLSIGIIPISIGDWVVQTRVFYEIPFQIPAAVAMTYIQTQSNGTIRSLPFYIWLIAVSIITASNF
jgi:hypothetical protein